MCELAQASLDICRDAMMNSTSRRRNCKEQEYPARIRDCDGRSRRMAGSCFSRRRFRPSYRLPVNRALGDFQPYHTGGVLRFTDALRANITFVVVGMSDLKRSHSARCFLKWFPGNRSARYISERAPVGLRVVTQEFERSDPTLARVAHPGIAPDVRRFDSSRHSR